MVAVHVDDNSCSVTEDQRPYVGSDRQGSRRRWVVNGVCPFDANGACGIGIDKNVLVSRRVKELHSKPKRRIIDYARRDAVTADAPRIRVRPIGEKLIDPV